MADKGKGNKVELALKQPSFSPQEDASGHIFITFIPAMAVLPACLTSTSPAIAMHSDTSS